MDFSQIVFFSLGILLLTQIFMSLTLVRFKKFPPIKFRISQLLILSSIANAIYIVIIIFMETQGKVLKESFITKMVLFGLTYISPGCLLMPHVLRSWTLRARFLKPAQRQKIRPYTTSSFLWVSTVVTFLICTSYGMVIYFQVHKSKIKQETTFFHEELAFGLLLAPFWLLSLWLLVKLQKMKRWHWTLSETQWVLVGIILITSLDMVIIIICHIWKVLIPHWIGSLSDMLFLLLCCWSQLINLFIPLISLWRWKRGRDMSIEAEASQRRMKQNSLSAESPAQSISMSQQAKEDRGYSHSHSQHQNDVSDSYSHYSANYYWESGSKDDSVNSMSVHPTHQSMGGLSIRRWIPNTHPLGLEKGRDVPSPSVPQRHTCFDPSRLCKEWDLDKILEDTPMLSQLASFAEKKYCLEMVLFCQAVMRYEKAWPVSETQSMDTKDNKSSESVELRPGEEVHSPFFAHAHGERAETVPNGVKDGPLPPSFLKKPSMNSLRLRPLLPPAGMDNLPVGRPNIDAAESNSRLKKSPVNRPNESMSSQKRGSQEKEPKENDENPQPTADQIKQLCGVADIFKQFVCPGAPNEVNVSGESRIELAECVNEPDLFFGKTSKQRASIFEGLKDEVIKLMELNLMRSFVKSEDYQMGLRGDINWGTRQIFESDEEPVRQRQSLSSPLDRESLCPPTDQIHISHRKCRVQPSESSGRPLCKQSKSKILFRSLIWKYVQSQKQKKGVQSIDSSTS